MCTCPVGVGFCALGVHGKLSQVSFWQQRWCLLTLFSSLAPHSSLPKRSPALMSPRALPLAYQSTWAKAWMPTPFTSSPWQARTDNPNLVCPSTALCHVIHQRNNLCEDYLSGKTRTCPIIIFILGKVGKKTHTRSKKNASYGSN